MGTLKSGWCIDGDHANCVVTVDRGWTCDCDCHTNEETT